MAGLELNEVRKSYARVDVVHGVDLSIADGEFVVFVGPSGCGKSTLLRMIAGLEDITSGALSIGGEDMTKVSPAERGVAMVFQSYALYPHMTVEENMGFGLKIHGFSKTETKMRVLKAAQTLQLENLLARMPKQLSGGQRQRVAIGRAIVREPDVFLFDEPLSNLDAELRVQMRLEIAKLHRDLGATMIYVTHDQVEAMTLADKIVVLRAGRIEQIGRPLDLYENPANMFVAGFIGSPKMNFLKARIVELDKQEAGVAIADSAGGQVRVTLAADGARQGDEVVLGIRPEHLSIGQTGDFEAGVDLIEHLGASSFVYAQGSLPGALIIEAGGHKGLEPGDRIKVALNPGRAFLFDPKDGKRL